MIIDYLYRGVIMRRGWAWCTMYRRIAVGLLLKAVGLVFAFFGDHLRFALPRRVSRGIDALGL